MIFHDFKIKCSQTVSAIFEGGIPPIFFAVCPGKLLLISYYTPDFQVISKKFSVVSTLNFFAQTSKSDVHAVVSKRRCRFPSKILPHPIVIFAPLKFTKRWVRPKWYSLLWMGFQVNIFSMKLVKNIIFWFLIFPPPKKNGSLKHVFEFTENRQIKNIHCSNG